MDDHDQTESVITIDRNPQSVMACRIAPCCTSLIAPPALFEILRSDEGDRDSIAFYVSAAATTGLNLS